MSNLLLFFLLKLTTLAELLWDFELVLHCCSSTFDLRLVPFDFCLEHWSFGLCYCLFLKLVVFVFGGVRLSLESKPGEM